MRYTQLNENTDFRNCNLEGTKFTTNGGVERTIYNRISMEDAQFLQDDREYVYEEPRQQPRPQINKRTPEEEASMRAQLAAADAEPGEYEEAAEGDPNTCFYTTGYYDVNIQKYLDKHPENLVIQVGDKVSCESLTNLKSLFYTGGEYDTYYECSAKNIADTARNGFTRISFSPDDYYTHTEYIKISTTTNIFVVREGWMYDGPVPAPRWFKLVNTGESKRLIQRSLTRRGANVVSGVHCDPLDTFDIYRLEPVISGGKQNGKIIKVRTKKHRKVNKIHRKVNKTHRKLTKKNVVKKSMKTVKRKNLKTTCKREKRHLNKQRKMRRK